MAAESAPPRGVRAPAFWLGFSLAGFFDGILLHQVLQWHHLLSNVEGAAFRDLRVQIAADGYFHVLMYLLLALAIWLVWRRRAALAAADAGPRFIQFLLIGFGVWQIVDVVLFHWILGIHNIRVGVDNPIVWDIGWLILLGALPLGLAAVLRAGGQGPRTGRGAAAASIAITLLAGAWAARPLDAAADTPTTIVFAPWVDRGEAFGATTSRSAALIWADARSGVFVVTGISRAEAHQLYGQGAMIITDRGFPPGCFSNFSPRP